MSAPRENLVGEPDPELEEKPRENFFDCLAPYELFDSWFLYSPALRPSLESALSSGPVRDPKQLSLSVLELLTFL